MPSSGSARRSACGSGNPQHLEHPVRARNADEVVLEMRRRDRLAEAERGFRQRHPGPELDGDLPAQTCGEGHADRKQPRRTRAAAWRSAPRCGTCRWTDDPSSRHGEHGKHGGPHSNPRARPSTSPAATTAAAAADPDGSARAIRGRSGGGGGSETTGHPGPLASWCSCTHLPGRKARLSPCNSRPGTP